MPRIELGTVRQRLWLAFGALLLAAGALAALMAWSTARLGGAVREAASLRLPASVALGRVAAEAAGYRIRQFQYTLAAEADRPALEKAMDQARGAIDAEVQRIAALSADPASPSRVSEARQLWSAYLGHDRRLRQLMADGLPLQATELLDGDARTTYDRVRDLLRALADDNATDAAALESRADALRGHSQWLMGLALLATLLLAAVLVWPLVRRLQVTLADATATAQSLADGRLNVNPQISGRDELAQLLAALGSMAARWRELVRDIRDSAESVATASSELASGSGHLSERTERQAAQVQEVGALVGALATSAILNSADAASADQRSRQAAASAREGVATLSALHDAIGLLAERSRRIADISGVIDRIANQTNILALNAAVEASRAGEHGRGFAVVAKEVRELARQSAQAANDIKRIVGENVRQTEEGVGLVRRASASVEALASDCDLSADGVTKIAATSLQQTQGVEQMKGRVAEIEYGMQQNAALSEQLAASADTMNEQAGRLVSLMQAFDTGEGRA